MNVPSPLVEPDVQTGKIIIDETFSDPTDLESTRNIDPGRLTFIGKEKIYECLDSNGDFLNEYSINAPDSSSACTGKQGRFLQV